MIKYFIYFGRILKIIFICAKHNLFFDLGELVKPRYRWIIKSFNLLYPLGFIRNNKLNLGGKLVNILPSLGPIYIKLGQILSVRPDIIGEKAAEALSLLQDKLPPFPGNEAKDILEKEYDTKLENIFLAFNLTSIAAASVAQVHRATLLRGQEVAVKILRPGIVKKYNKDIELLFFIAKMFKILLPKYSRLKPKEVVDSLHEQMKIELDLRMEAAASSRLKENSALDDNVYIPIIYWDFVTNSILVSEWMDAIPVSNTNALKEAGIDLKILACNLSIIFFNQAFRDGYFHADLHPGNILISRTGKIILIDFGIMGSLEYSERRELAKIFHAFLIRDYEKVAKIHIKLGYVPKNTNVMLFAQACRAIGEPILSKPQNKISIARLLAHLLKVTEDFSMETQPQLLLLQKTIVVLEGLGQKLAPESNIWQLASPWIEKWVQDNFSLEAKVKNFIKKIACKILERIEDEDY